VFETLAKARSCLAPEPLLNNIRVELYKLFYEKAEFVVNEKADAFEALQAILGSIHVNQSNKLAKTGAQIKFDAALD